MAQTCYLGEHRRNPKLTQVGYLHDKSRVELLRKALNAKFKNKSGLKVLDLGCGWKPYYPLLEENASEYIGIDIEKGTKMDVMCNGETLPFANDRFDAILCSQVLEHLKEPRKALAEMYRVMKKGFLFLFVPSFWPLHHAPHDYYRWTRYGIKKDLGDAGFSDIEIFNCGGSVSGILQMIMLAIDGYFNQRQMIKKFLSLCVYPILNVVGLTFDERISNKAFTSTILAISGK